MEEMTRLSVHVPADVPGKLVELAGGVKKMGSYLTTFIRNAHAGQASVGKPGELDMVSSAVMHLSAKVKELEARLQQVEEGR